MATASRSKLTQKSKEQVFSKKKDKKEWKSNKRNRAKTEEKEPFVNRLNKQIPEQRTGNACRYCINGVEVCYWMVEAGKMLVMGCSEAPSFIFALR